jgi:hypothetical protein
MFDYFSKIGKLSFVQYYVSFTKNKGYILEPVLMVSCRFNGCISGFFDGVGHNTTSAMHFEKNKKREMQHQDS